MITGTYNLTINPSWKNVQESEVFLECDTTTAPVTINLFEIAGLNRFWNVRIIVSDANNNAGTNNITINAGGSDSIDESGTNQVVINSNGSSVSFQVASENQWLAVESVSGSSSTLVIDGDESDYYKYADLGGSNILGYSHLLSQTITDLIVKNIQGTTQISIFSDTLKNLTVTDCTGITSMYSYCPQLESLTIPSGLQYLSVYGQYSNGQSFGLSTAPDLTPSEDTLTYIEITSTQIQFTYANYFQIANKANVTYIDLGNSVQLNNSLPVGLFNGLTGLNNYLGLYQMNLQTIGAGFFNFLGIGNSGLYIDLYPNSLTVTSIDNIITDCLDRATNNGAINITLNISGGTNAIPSAQALTDIGTLTGTYGWTIYYNS